MSARAYARVFVALLVGLVVLAATAQAQTTWYVDDDAPNDPCHGDPTCSDSNEAGTPEHPFDAIQEGIDAAADGDTVLVLDGTYTGDGNRDIDFAGKAITVQSEDGPEVSVIDCEASYEDQHRGFYFHGGEIASSILAGLTITNGLITGSDEYGAGIYCDASSPTISNCIAKDGYSRSGGGLACQNQSDPTITGCTFENNRASFEGGGIYCMDSSPTIIACTFRGNTVSSRGGARRRRLL